MKKNRTPGLKAQYPSEYGALINAIHRCHNTSHPHYANYGGRGIKVCDEWRGPKGFDAFLAHIGPKPASHYTIERRDNDGSYEPGNVCWATRREQTLNRRCTRWVTIGGVTRTFAQWEEVSGISQHNLRSRIERGWPEDHLLLPVRTTTALRLPSGGRRGPQAHLYPFRGEMMTVREIAQLVSLHPTTVRERMKGKNPLV